MSNKKTKKIIIGVFGVLIMVSGGAVIADNQIDPYTDKGQTLEISQSSAIQQGGEVKKIISKNEPKITLSKFNGEVNLGIRYTGLAPDTASSRPFLSKNVEWTQGDVKMEALPIEATDVLQDGGMEINIILNAEPASNVFSFQLDNYKNLDFFYQLPLWKEMGFKDQKPDCTDTDCTTIAENGMDVQSHRPENVVGSYAVYYKEHQDHVEGQTNYATGKAYHIFRPLVTDANNNTVWADLKYSNGILSVIVPQNFLDTAVYPIKIDPNFGFQTQGASVNTHTADFAFSNPVTFSPATAGTMTSYTIFCSGTGTTKVKMALYNGTTLINSTQPNSGTCTSAGGGAFLTVNAGTATTISAAVAYRFAFKNDSSSNSEWWDAGGAGNTGFSASVFANEFGTGVTWSDLGVDRKYSLYATYAIVTTSSSVTTVNNAIQTTNNATIIIP